MKKTQEEIQTRITELKATAECQLCLDVGWVCECHENKSWDLECDNTPGKPCVCNPSIDGAPPEKTGMSVVLFDTNGCYLPNKH